MPEEQGSNDGLHRGYSALVDVCCAIATRPSERDLTHSILEIIRDAFEADVCTLRLLDEASGVLTLAASLGLTTYSKPVRLGESVVGRAVLERKPFSVSNIGESSYKKSSFISRHGLESLVSIPLLHRDKAIGGVTLYSSKPEGYQPTDIKLLVAIAAQLASVIENTQLVRDTVSTLVSLARATEAKDTYTQGHSQRVTAYAVRLAEKTGLSGKDLAVLKLVAPMHDIGKIGISEKIIKKPARLSPEEREIMKEHPVIGETIVNSIRSLQPGLFLIRNHHERVDGSGYPDGLVGEEIPFAARIVAIADAYDAMTSQRPYRDPLTPAAADDELAANAGTQFDGALVEAFSSLDRRDIFPSN